MEFIAATNNAHKLAEMRRILVRMGHTVLSQREAGVLLEPEETGTTFEENAAIKAQAICEACQKPTIADDSGLCVDALDGAPGVINYENNGGYNPVDIYFNDWEIKRVVDQLMDGTYSNGDHNMYINLYSSLLNTQCTDRADTYFILKDFRSYADAQKRVEEAYRDQQKWSKMAMLNTACSGKFTSDRTIEEYVRDIWHLEKVEVPSGQDLFD